MASYANVIVDISLEKLDKTFQYRIPSGLEGKIEPGVQVEVPFGKRRITGYVVEITDLPEYNEEKLRPLAGIHEGSVAIESRLIALAGWMRKNYGSTMNQALKVVLPIKQKTGPVVRRTVALALPEEEALRQLALFEGKHFTARARLLRELIHQGEMDYRLVTQKLNISAAVVKALEEKGILTIQTKTSYRDPIRHLSSRGYHLTLNEDQQRVVDRICGNLNKGIQRTYLLKGITGSGKTEVYMELIAHVIEKGKQAIVLIPEIALTYQTVMRFYNRFGSRVSILNSRMSAGERYDQYLRAKNGDIDIMIGPRSALFTPFADLGMIIMDEEHESSYKSETSPRYHARETAIERARMSGACVVLGSATPSVDSYYQAQLGNYELLEMKKRVEEKPLPECEVVDLRQELRSGNRSVLSMRLQELMEDRLKKGQQMMLFLNRRGVSGFLSCRACGHVLKCPHCDVSLSLHNNGRMKCHYCGYEESVPKACPSCGSKHIAGFKTGTQKVEQLVQARFPGARILRMDFDTTRTKDGYEKILQAFANQEADILIGTQMIVKGHDFPHVTLVGILAADMSLHVSDYRAAERTFQLLTQAAGRAGRGKEPGQVIIQTYDPEHFAIRTAQKQDYEAFYEQEIAYRQLMHYPPAWNLLMVIASSKKEEELEAACDEMAAYLHGIVRMEQGAPAGAELRREKETVRAAVPPVQIVGPADASIAKVNDIYRKVIYIKTKEYQMLVRMKDRLEENIRERKNFRNISVQFDFNPMGGF